MTVQKTQNLEKPSDYSSTASKPTLQAWVAWAIVSFFYAFQYILRVSPSIMIDDIRLKFGLDTQQFGDYSGIYYIGYALMHIPVGLMLDHFSPRLVIAGSILICSLGLAPLVFTDSWELAFWSRFLLGAGSSTAILGVFKVIRMNFPAKKLGTILGFSITIGLLGAIYGGQPVQNFVAVYGWQNVLQGLIYIGFGLAVLTYFLIPKRREEKQSMSTTTIWQDIIIVCKAPFVITTALFAALMVGPLEGFADVWGISYFIQVYGFSKETASFLPSLIFFGMCFGSPFLAFISEKKNSHVGIVKLSGLAMCLLFIAMLATKLPLWQLQTSMFVIGVFCAYQVLIIHINSMRVDAHHSGIVTAITNMIIMSFGYVFHHFIGYIMNESWAGDTVDGIRVYPTEAYTNGLSIIPIALGLAILGFLCERVYSRFKKQS